MCYKSVGYSLLFCTASGTCGTAGVERVVQGALVTWHGRGGCDGGTREVTSGEGAGGGMGQRDSLAVSGREGRPVGEELGMCPDLRRKELGIWRKSAKT